MTGLILKYTKGHNLELPLRDRDIHRKQLPRIGGLAIFLAFLTVTMAYHLANPNNFAGFGFPFAVLGFSIDKRLLAVLLGSVVIVGAMVIDDLRGLRPYQKLSLQILAGLVIVAGGIGIRYINNPFGGPPIYLDQLQIALSLGGVTYHILVWADLLAVAWLVMLMNVLNFSDGIDGLAGSISGSALLILLLLSLEAIVNQPSTALLAAIGLGSVLGFLVWNLPPARIFMGDSGSMFLGFLIGVIGLIAGAKLATTAVVLAIPILDAILVIVGRVIRGQNPFTHPDQTHLHHRFLKAGFTVKQTLIALSSISLLFGISALQNSTAGKLKLFLLAVIITLIILAFISGAASKKQKRDNLG